MASPIKSAKTASVLWNNVPIPNVINEQHTIDAGVQRHSTSSTAGIFVRNQGATDQSGTFTVLTDQLPASMTAGAIGDLVVKSDAATEIYNGKAFIESIRPSFPIDGGADDTVEVTWGRTLDPLPS